MSLKRLKSVLTASTAQSSFVVGSLSTLDKSIPTFRTVLVVAGIVAAALDVDPTADYLFAAGLLLHFTIWFENWWHELRAR
jgi:hypothetical protein